MVLGNGYLLPEDGVHGGELYQAAFYVLCFSAKKGSIGLVIIVTNIQSSKEGELAEFMMQRNFICTCRQLSIGLFAFLLLGCATLPEAVSEKNTVEQPVSAQTTPVGNVETGRNLFMGYRHFQNDGPACMGCHSVGSNGLLGGGALGPDLTDVTTRRSPLELAATLGSETTTLSPVMEPIYAEHPLTAVERADLIAFLTASVGQPESNAEPLILGISIAGFLGVVVLIQWIYRKRLRGVRKPMVRNQ